MDRIMAIETCYDKIYHVFKEGDEVYTENRNYKAITPNKPYIVLRCYTPPGYIDGYPVRLIDIVTDGGYVSPYGTDKFKKTYAQLRQDKIDSIFENNI